MRYGRELGCKFGQPHDLVMIHETIQVKHEQCKICSKRFRWNKGYKMRIENAEYLKAHVRNFAQRTGPTKRVYHKLYSPEKTKIVI